MNGYTQIQSEGVRRCIPCKWKLKESMGRQIRKNRLSQTLARDQEGHYVMLTGSIQQEDIAIVNIYASNIRTPKYIKKRKIELNGEINSNIILIGKFNKPPLNNG